MSTINHSLKLLMNLAKMQAIMSRKFDGLSVHGIGFSDFMILYLLQQAPGERLRRTDLAEKVGLTASGITRMLLPMEKTGLVSRESSERDARVSYAVLTPAGRRVYEEAKETANAIAKEIVPTEITRNQSLAALFKLLGTTI
ncbi:MarR family winged helix-turn-helix transcriptional regulator [Chitinophaga filiformis]|uniref:MarR family transcriptional regulator n=1 Tax=Chitinophaga filiformis TaxID=104663 RepID=A0ABY4I2V8_CHIFI|nr:MarR family transcriptional regulator [Chitinophaga filiformis]UPK69086.1 MarR family transcriptional regulator [Chitinophaga filiformis]